MTAPLDPTLRAKLREAMTCLYDWQCDDNVVCDPCRCRAAVERIVAEREGLWRQHDGLLLKLYRYDRTPSRSRIAPLAAKSGHDAELRALRRTLGLED